MRLVTIVAKDNAQTLRLLMLRMLPECEMEAVQKISGVRSCVPDALKVTAHPATQRPETPQTASPSATLMAQSKANIHIPRSIKHSTQQHKPTPNLSPPHLRLTHPKLIHLRIIRPEKNHHMHQRHSYQYRDVASECDFVFCKEFLRANIAPADTKDYDDAGEDGAPPADEEGRLVFAEEAVGWGVTIQRHRGGRTGTEVEARCRHRREGEECRNV